VVGLAGTSIEVNAAWTAILGQRAGFQGCVGYKPRRIGTSIGCVGQYDSASVPVFVAVRELFKAASATNLDQRARFTSASATICRRQEH